jgi:hypothetical protein
VVLLCLLEGLAVGEVALPLTVVFQSLQLKQHHQNTLDLKRDQVTDGAILGC